MKAHLQVYRQSLLTIPATTFGRPCWMEIFAASALVNTQSRLETSTFRGKKMLIVMSQRELIRLPDSLAAVLYLFPFK